MTISIEGAEEARHLEELDHEDEVYRPLKDDGADTTHLVTPEELDAQDEAAQ
jgi:hypothetical protein